MADKWKFLELKRGATREVILVWGYAVKIPSLRCWRMFLHGLLANMQESTFSGFSDRLCPVLVSMPGGFFNIMPRCSPLSMGDAHLMFRKADTLEIEYKIDSFGFLDSRDCVVAVDYGS